MTVIRTEPVAPAMTRVVLGGEGFADFARNHAAMPQRYTDEYVKLVFLPAGFEHPEPLDLDVVKRTMPPEAWPVLRTYTVRRVDLEARELAIDFVVHGTEGVAGPWAARARPGDVIHVRGPNGGYAPDPDADWYLFVGDEAGLPAIAASLEALPEGARAVAFIEVDGPADEIELPTAATLDLHWLHRGAAAPGTTTLLDDAVRGVRVAAGPGAGLRARRVGAAEERPPVRAGRARGAPGPTCRCRPTGAGEAPRRASGSGSPSRPRR